jgi:hypothetical protein
MFDHKHYVPILKAKQSECIALRNLNSDLKENMIPLFEMQPRETQRLLERTIGQIETSWEKHLPLYLDIDKDYLSSNNDEALTNFVYALNRSQSKKYKFIPVTGLRRSTRYQEIIQSSIKQQSNGVCVRLESIDWLDLQELNQNIENLVSKFDLSYDAVDILLDFGAFLPSQSGTIVTSAATTINKLSKLRDFRNLVISGTAFPANPPLAIQSVHKLPRSEWLVWTTLKSGEMVERMPIFGDYTIVHPKFPELDFRYVEIAPKIKYTAETEWIFIRWDRGNWAAFHDVCRLLVRQPEFSGEGFSWGDSRIYECSTNAYDTGNPGQWVTIGINHHLTFVTEQIASFPGL